MLDTFLYYATWEYIDGKRRKVPVTCPRCEDGIFNIVHEHNTATEVRRIIVCANCGYTENRDADRTPKGRRFVVSR